MMWLEMTCQVEARPDAAKDDVANSICLALPRVGGGTRGDPTLNLPPLVRVPVRRDHWIGHEGVRYRAHQIVGAQGKRFIQFCFKCKKQTRFKRGQPRVNLHRHL